MVFVSHETYTPARGGSAAAEVSALRQVFGAAADRDRRGQHQGLHRPPDGRRHRGRRRRQGLETGIVPPVPNFKEVDPDLGLLQPLDRGGYYPCATRCARRWVRIADQHDAAALGAHPDGRRPEPDALGYAPGIADPDGWRAWLRAVSGEADPHSRSTTGRSGRPRDTVAGLRPSRVAELTARSAPAATAPVVSRPSPRSSRHAPAAPRPGCRWSPPGVSSRRTWRRGVVALVAEQTGYPPELLDSTSTSRPTSASTRSSRPRCSPRSARPTRSPATTP